MDTDKLDKVIQTGNSLINEFKELNDKADWMLKELNRLEDKFNLILNNEITNQ